MLITADDAHISGGEPALAQGVHRRDTLPRRGGHQAFAEGLLNGKPRAGPIMPGCRFIPIHPRHALQPIAEQMRGAVSAEFGARPAGGLGARLMIGE